LTSNYFFLYEKYQRMHDRILATFIFLLNWLKPLTILLTTNGKRFSMRNIIISNLTSTSATNINNYYHIRSAAQSLLLDYDISRSEELTIALHKIDGEQVARYDLSLLPGKSTHLQDCYHQQIITSAAAMTAK